MLSVDPSRRTMKKSAVIVIAVIAAILLVGFGAWYLANSPATYSGISEPISIGILPNEQSALILIAEDQGYFGENGLNATVKTYDTALAAVEGMKLGEVDIAESAEFPIVREAFKKENVSIIAWMEDEGRWMINNNLTSENAIPDFRDYIYMKGLEEVKPASMNIYPLKEDHGDPNLAWSKHMEKIIAVIAVVAAIVLAGLGGWLFLDSQKSAAKPVESITVAYSPYEASALFWIAEDLRFFEENGLNLTLRRYDSGAASLDGVINGEADISVGASEFPLVRKAFQNARVQAVGNIDKGDFIYIIARKDRGIGNVSDLKGKKVGTAIGTAAEFHLGRFLTLHGMTMRDITLIDIKTPEEWVNAVADGNIDAISTAQPYANAARDRLGDNHVFWPAQSSQPVFSLIISTDDWIAENPELVEKFLASLAKADEYAAIHPAKAQAIVQKRLNLSAEYMDTVWQQNQFTLSLDQSLILAMEDEARWMISNNLTTEKTMPDFRDYIYIKGLEAVKPESVNIIS